MFIYIDLIQPNFNTIEAKLLNIERSFKREQRFSKYTVAHESIQIFTKTFYGYIMCVIGNILKFY